MRRPWLLTILFIVSACEPLFEPPADCEPVPYRSTPLTCTDRPDLCSAVTQRDLSGPAQIVFLAEGFTAEREGAFLGQAQMLVHQLKADSSTIVGRRKELFSFHYVFAPSSTGKIANGDRTDSAVGACLDADALKPSSPRRFVSLDLDAATLASEQAASKPSAVVVLIDTERFDLRASAGRAIKMGLWDDYFTLDHELGHALIGLDDEYSDIEGCYEDGIPRLPKEVERFVSPNLSRYPDGHWSELLQTAPKEGGGRFSRCVYRPTDSCRMNDSDAPRFCPVCEKHIEARLNELAGRPDPTMHCIPYLWGDESPFEFVLFARDLDGLTSMSASVDDQYLFKATFDTSGAYPLQTSESIYARFDPKHLTDGTRLLSVTCTDARGNVFEDKSFLIVKNGVPQLSKSSR